MSERILTRFQPIRRNFSHPEYKRILLIRIGAAKKKNEKNKRKRLYVVSDIVFSFL